MMTQPAAPAASALDNSQSPDNQPSNGGQQPQGAEDEAGSTRNSFFIPADTLGGKTYQPGDELTLKVVGHDQDGDLEVTMAGNESGDATEGEAPGGDWRSELRGKLDENQGNAAQ